jgi:16S rRNA (cytidine1402-2'-O)-methyltransferase
MNTLYVVATPIGNLEDITLRAIRILGEVDTIACEDTRHTRILLEKYHIDKRMIACHAHNEAASAAGIVKLLAEGQDVAYVSDAGTPGISDPGAKVVQAVREAGFTIVAVPGVSAVATLVSVAGTIGKTFTFEGFTSPRKGRRRSRLNELLGREEAFVLYESPFRIVKLLEDITALAPGRTVTVGREMTKAYEEFLSGSVDGVIAALSSRDSIKGEFAVCVHPARIEAPQEGEETPL